ncbi:MAG TPA: hypothetical protein VGE10_05720 [Zeimonas sp.]
MTTNSCREAIRAALAAPKKERRAAVGDALLDALETLGLEPDEAAQALAAIGYRASRAQLIDLYQAVLLMERMHRGAGTFRRGTMKALYASQASIWQKYGGSGDPEGFRKSYENWRRKTRGGGLTRHFRAGFEGAKKKNLAK